MKKIINGKKYDTETAEVVGKFRKIINGKKYDTETAEVVGKWRTQGIATSDFYYKEEILYKKNNGEFFLYGYGGAMTRWRELVADSSIAGEDILPYSSAQAKNWVEMRLPAEEYERLFGEVEE